MKEYIDQMRASLYRKIQEVETKIDSWMSGKLDNTNEDVTNTQVGLIEVYMEIMNLEESIINIETALVELNDKIEGRNHG